MDFQQGLGPLRTVKPPSTYSLPRGTLQTNIIIAQRHPEPQEEQS